MAASRLRCPTVGDALAAEPAALPPDGGELPAATLEGATRRLEHRMPTARVPRHPLPRSTPPRRRARARRRRAAPERGARADAAAGHVPVEAVAAADWNGGAPPDVPRESSPEIVAPGEAADAAVRESLPPERVSDNGLGEVAEPVPLAAKRTTRRTRRRGTAARPAEGGEPPEVVEHAEPVEVARDEAPMPNEPERDEAPPPDEPAMAATAMADRRDAGPPRRGWWSRFVRKDE